MTRMHTRHVLSMSIIGIALVAAACSSSEPTAASTPSGSADAEIAPAFTVETNGDSTFSLAEHITDDGRPVFLNLWASWCFPCREEMPAIDRSSQSFPEVAFLGVSVQDTRPDAEAFVDEIDVTYLIGFDEDGQLDAAYRPLGLPASYLISGDGIIVERIFGKVTEEDLADKFEQHFGITADD